MEKNTNTRHVHMKEMVDFTIVTVTYNCDKTLEKTILSVINQTYKNFEYIIIDGESTDKTIDIIRQYNKYLSSWISEKDNGIYDAMNKGIRMASGKWIIFMNSGDVFANNDVLQKVKIITSKDDHDILYGNIFIEKKGHLILKEAAEPCNKQRMYFCHQSAFTKTSILKEMPFDIRFKMSSDLHFFKRCYYKHFKFKHIKQTIAIYDQTGISNTNRLAGLLDNVAVIKDIDKAPEKYKFLLKLYFVITRIRISNFFKNKK